MTNSKDYLQKEQSPILFQIMWYIFFLFLLVGNISEHNIYSDLAVGACILTGLLVILSHGKIYCNIYFILSAVFITYHLCLLISGVAVYPNITSQSLQTMTLNLGIMFLIYNFIVISNNVERLFKTYIWSSVTSLVIVMYLLKDTLFVGRLAHAYGEGAVSYYFLGQAISMCNNGLATMCALGFVLSIFYFIKERKYLYLITSLYLTFGVILTGSRKGIMLLILYFAILMLITHANKKIRISIFISLTVLIGYYIMIKIPVLYSIAGERLEALLQFLIGSSVHEGSINARMLYAQYGIKEFGNNPILGKGLGMFPNVYDNVTEINYLEMLVSGGLIGLILYYLYTIPLFTWFFKYKNFLSQELLLSFFLACSVLIVDFGSVTYDSRKYLLLTVTFFALVHTFKNLRK